MNISTKSNFLPLVMIIWGIYVTNDNWRSHVDVISSVQLAELTPIHSVLPKTGSNCLSLKNLWGLTEFPVKLPALPFVGTRH